MSLFNQSFDRDLAYTAKPPASQDLREIEKSFARVFASDEGKKVLAHLQVMTFHKALSPDAGHEQLRYAEGQRALVASILRLIDRGRS